MPKRFSTSARASRNFRLVPGALASPELLAWGARTAILCEADRLYPEMRLDLMEIAPKVRDATLETFRDLPKIYEQFCRKWGLVWGREPAKWALEMVERTALWAAATGRWPGWQLHYAECVPDAGDELYWQLYYVPDAEEKLGWRLYCVECVPDAEEKLGWEPDAEPWRRARRRIPRRLWKRAAGVIRAWREAGWQPVRARRQPEVVEWAVRHQIGGESWESLAAERDSGSDARKLEARELLRLAGLRKERGRPPLHR